LGPASYVNGKTSIQPEIPHICRNFVIRNFQNDSYRPKVSGIARGGNFSRRKKAVSKGKPLRRK